MPNFRNPRVQLIGLLSILFLITIFHLPILQSLMLLVFGVGGAAGFDYLFATIKRQELRIPYSGIISGLILALIIDPTASWWQILVIAAAVTGIKDFIRPTGSHIFNPAASGLMVGFLLFGLNPSWWGPSPYGFGLFHPADLAVAISVFSLAYVSLWRYKRYFNVVSFLVVSIVLQIVLLSTSPVNAFQALINPGSLFFALVMLPEPMTTPSNKIRQALFGVFVAVFNIGVIYLMANGLIPAFNNFPDTSLVALLLANLLFFKFK